MRLRILPVMVGILFTLGAGCAATEPPAVDTSSMDAVQSDIKGTTDAENAISGSTGITLIGTSTGSNSVRLEWNPSDEVVATAQKWMVLVGNTENPAYPKDNLFWYQRDKGYREYTWKKLPKGELHFRICAWVGRACTTYSNDLVMEIPGYTPGTK